MYARPIIRLNAKGKRGAPLRIEFRYKDIKKEWTIAKIDPDKWNPIKNEVRGDRMLNLRIQDVITRFDAAVNHKLNNNEAVDVNQLSAEIIGKQPGIKSTKLLDYLVETISTSKWSYGTLKTYNALKVRLQDFDPDIKISSIDLKWVDKLEEYLKKSGNESGTIWTRKKVLKTILNKAVEDKYLKENPLIGMKNKRESKIPQYLSLEEFKSLAQYKPQNQAEVLAKDLYCFGVYTGLRFSDIFFLRSSKIISDGNDTYRLSMNEVKTGNKISNRLSQPAIAILKKYGFPKDGIIFPMFKPSEPVNSHLDNRQKETWNAYINKTMYGICAKFGFRRMGFHTSRHTHACISLDLGIPITTISASLGHSKLAMTEHYARVKNKQMDEAADKWSSI
jgi:integrase